MKNCLKENKYPAPALARGYYILTELSEHGAMSLELLAKKTGTPKSSLLRLLDTLIQIGAVERETETKHFRSLVSIVPLQSDSEVRLAEIRKCLRGVSEKTSLTSEWYVYSREKMVIVERYEADCHPVQVKANIGFPRMLDEEFESVARIALAFGCHPPVKNKKNRYWKYKSGRKVNVSASEYKRALDDIRREGVTMDPEYNMNGVRRYAAAVCPEEKGLLGILALAENFTPDADRLSAANLKILKQAADDLTEIAV